MSTASTLIAAARATEPVAWRIRIGPGIRIDLTRREAAGILGLSYDQVRGLVDSGALDTVRRNTHIPVASIFAFLRVEPRDALLGDLDGTPRLALTAAEAAGLHGMHPSLLRRALAASGLPTGWTGHAHVIPISTVLALAAGAGSETPGRDRAA